MYIPVWLIAKELNIVLWLCIPEKVKPLWWATHLLASEISIFCPSFSVSSAWWPPKSISPFVEILLILTQVWVFYEIILVLSRDKIASFLPLKEYTWSQQVSCCVILSCWEVVNTFHSVLLKSLGTTVYGSFQYFRRDAAGQFKSTNIDYALWCYLRAACNGRKYSCSKRLIFVFSSSPQHHDTHLNH